MFAIGEAQTKALKVSSLWEILETTRYFGRFCHRVNPKESTTNNYFSRLKAKTNTRLNICRIFFKGSLLINTYVRVDQDRFSVVWCVATTVYVAKALIICFLYFLNYRLDQNELYFWISQRKKFWSLINYAGLNYSL